MITCPKCSSELPDDSKFCDNCGASVTENPVEEMPTVAPAGEMIAETPEMPEEVPAEEIPAAEPAAKKKLPLVAMVFGGIGLAAIAVLVLVISLLFGGGKTDNYALYLKDSEIFYTDLKKNSEAWQVTSRLIDSDDMDEEDLAESGYALGRYVTMSEDGKYLFFVDKVSDSDDGCNLYYREVAKPKKDAVKIDSDVRYYTVNSSTTLVTYTKGDDGDLYQYQIGKDEKDKVASDIRYGGDFDVSDDGKKIIYVNTEGNLYLKNSDGDKEKIASDVYGLQYITSDFKTVYYIKDETLYKHEIGKDKEQIVSDIYSVIKFYDSGEIYYLKNSSSDLTLMDYVEDDMKSADAGILEPTYPEYPESPDSPSWWDYETTDEYYAAYDEYEIAYYAWVDECDRIESEYDAAYDAYWAKAERDGLREELQGETMDFSSYALCFYDGKEEVVVSESFTGYDYTLAAGAPVITYEAYNQTGVSKVKISEIDSIYDVEYMIEEALYNKTERFIAVKGAPTAVEQEKEATSFTINDSGTMVYYIDDIPDEKNYGELYRIAIKKGVPEKAELYDSDVYTGQCYFVNDTDIVYFKDYKEGEGELYISKNKIDYDVQVYNFRIDGDNVFYFTDWNDEKEYGTLKVHNGKDSEKVSDDVHSFTVTPDGRILYLYDYSIKYYKGELHEWSKGKTRKIDEDVIYVLPILDYKFRGGSW